MNANKKIHDTKLAHWITLIREQSESGLTISDWCVQKGLSKHAYYYWKRIAKESYVDSVIPEIVPIGPSDHVQDFQAISTLPVVTTPDSYSSYLSDSHELAESCKSTGSLQLHDSRELHDSHELRNSHKPASNNCENISIAFNDIHIDIGSSATDELITRIIGVLRHA